MKTNHVLLALILVIFLLLTPCIVSAQGDSEEEDSTKEWEETMDRLMIQIDLNGMNHALTQTGEAGYRLLGKDIHEAVLRAANGEMRLDVWAILQSIFASLLEAIKSHGTILIKVLVLAAIGAVIGALKPSFASQGVAEAAGLISYLLIIALLAQLLYSVIASAQNAIDDMSRVISAVFPILLLLLTALGGSASVAVFSPAMTVVTSGIGLFMKETILPMVLVCGVVTMAASLSNKARLKTLAGFIKKLAAWAIGLVFVVFLGVTALQGMSGAAIDGVTLRTAKFTIDRFVPIIGGMFSGTVDTLLACTLVVKNGVGIVGTLLLAINILKPVLSIAAISFLLNFAAALIEPFGEKRVIQCIADLSGVTTLFAVCVLALGSMMFILVTLAIGAGNINVMMR